MAEDLELTVTVHDLQRVEARVSDDGRASGRVLRDDLRKRTIEVLEGWLRHSLTVSRTDLEVLGEHLFEMLFNGELRELLLDRLEKAGTRHPLRLRLEFAEEARELARYPWEYLFLRERSGRAFFLSTYTRLVLSRRLVTSAPSVPLTGADHSLRILMAVAEPDDKDLGPVLAQPVIDAVNTVAADLTTCSDATPASGCRTEVMLIELTTLAGLIGKIEDFKPQVVHLLGHGRFDRASGSGAVALLKSALTRQVDWVSDNSLMDRFNNLDVKPRLVFLHMCEAGEVAFERNFAGVAPKLITAGVQAVVAMQHPISNRAAISFAREFYKRLGNGLPIDHAVQFGRDKVSIDFQAEREFGTPVLYMQSSDGVILPPAPAAPAALPAGDGAAGTERPRPTSGASEVPVGVAAEVASAGGSSVAPPTPAPVSPLPIGGQVQQLAGAGTAKASGALRPMQQAGSREAARLGVFDAARPELRRLAACGNAAEARATLDQLIGVTDDDDLLSVWNAMTKALNQIP